MSCVKSFRCLIPRFAQIIHKTTTMPIPVIHRRTFFQNKKRFCSSAVKLKRETVTVYFIDRDGDIIETKATVGSSLLTVAIDNEVELEVTVNFMAPDGTKMPAKAKVGDNLLDIVIENDLDLDGYGACEGTLACSTCHLIFTKEDYDKLPEEPTDEELDMLDLAYGLTDTSRLGCQIIVTKDMDGLTVRVPAGVADAREPF